jgi:hypothetical protein
MKDGTSIVNEVKCTRRASLDDIKPMEVHDLAPIDKHGVELVPDTDIYPRLGDVPAMNDVYREFMKGGDLEIVAASYGIEARTAFKWATRGKWVRSRREVEDTKVEEEQLKLQKFRVAKRLPELEKQVATGTRLRERIDELLNDNDLEFRAKELMELGSALKSAGDNTVRALGIGESGMTETKADAVASGKSPLVILVHGGGLPPSRAAASVEIIDP